jgi:hypothetical protein
VWAVATDLEEERVGVRGARQWEEIGTLPRRPDGSAGHVPHVRPRLEVARVVQARRAVARQDLSPHAIRALPRSRRVAKAARARRLVPHLMVGGPVQKERVGGVVRVRLPKVRVALYRVREHRPVEGRVERC